MNIYLQKLVSHQMRYLTRMRRFSTKSIYTYSRNAIAKAVPGLLTLLLSVTS